MAGKDPVSLRIPHDVRSAIEGAAHRAGRSFSSVANEMLTEAIKMRRLPGIVFADGPSGRRACLAGTGIDVWEVVRTYREIGEERVRLAQAYHWLTEHQLRAALAYESAYADEIEARLRQEEHWTPEAAWTALPFAKPDDR